MPKLHHDAYIRLRSKPTGDWLVHPELRARLIEQADADATSLTDTVVKILAGRFGYPQSSRERQARAAQLDAEVLKVKIPIDLWRTLGIVATNSDRSENDVIREILCGYYGLKVPDGNSRPHR